MRILTQTGNYINFTNEDIAIIPSLLGETIVYQIVLSDKEEDFGTIGYYEDRDFAEDVIKQIINLHKREPILERMLWEVNLNSPDLTTIIDKQVFVMPEEEEEET